MLHLKITALGLSIPKTLRKQYVVTGFSTDPKFHPFNYQNLVSHEIRLHLKDVTDREALETHALRCTHAHENLLFNINIFQSMIFRVHWVRVANRSSGGPPCTNTRISFLGLKMLSENLTIGRGSCRSVQGLGTRHAYSAISHRNPLGLTHVRSNESKRLSSGASTTIARVFGVWITVRVSMLGDQVSFWSKK